MNACYTFPSTLREPSSDPITMVSSNFSFAPFEVASQLSMPQHAYNTQRTLFSPASHLDPGYSQAPNRSSATEVVSDTNFAKCLRSIDGSEIRTDQEHGSCIAGTLNSEAVVAETIVRARKSWKTVKGRSEAVWPPHLEKALVQALLKYKPNDARFTRALGRFPKRNRYISDYIYETTGVRRTPKQVGSRLQQLKDVSCGKMLLNHVASWSQKPSSDSADGHASDSPPISDAPLESHSLLGAISNSMREFTPDSEGSSSPVTPIRGRIEEMYFSSSLASSTVISDPYAEVMQVALPPANWYGYDQYQHMRMHPQLWHYCSDCAT